MFLKGERTLFVRDMNGFVVHLNMPGWLMPKARDHGHGPLAMVVESILVPGRLIDMHEHRDDEIISWVPSGVMRHHDKTMGALIVDSEHLMVMNAGHGFWHSEETLKTDPPLRMLQIFVRPRAIGLEPRVQHGALEPIQLNKWRYLVGPEDGKAPFLVRNDLQLFDVRLAPGSRLEFPSKNDWHLYFYVFSGSITARGQSFAEGEQGLLAGEGQLAFETTAPASLVAFLINPHASITRKGTVGDHPRIPSVRVMRLLRKWLQFRRWWRGR